MNTERKRETFKEDFTQGLYYSSPFSIPILKLRWESLSDEYKHEYLNFAEALLNYLDSQGVRFVDEEGGLPDQEFKGIRRVCKKCKRLWPWFHLAAQVCPECRGFHKTYRLVKE